MAKCIPLFCFLLILVVFSSGTVASELQGSPGSGYCIDIWQPCPNDTRCATECKKKYNDYAGGVCFMHSSCVCIHGTNCGQ
ncbi:hypothetical protein FRX31_031845 [Thalictrum thalictroides]|uniref:Defensin-like protein n=1 Tax=Thalictrum thalictroides TaxID=46969 RepID=A0A7J6V1C2_THATH|nr:hypothetical protein FRX31_031845 [Thalictrum thalictroides]